MIGMVYTASLEKCACMEAEVHRLFGVQVFVVCCDSPDLELEYDVEEEGSGRDKVYIARVT